MTMQLQKQPKRYGLTVIVIGVVAIILVSIMPLFMIRDSEFNGADGLGAETIETIAPDYDPGWATNWWSPPGGETESALFALQAAIGGILIGYFFGYFHGKKKGQGQLTTSDDRT